MSYENAPATKLLATHCCICGRPLCDAVSVEAGIGPDCREKYGYNNITADETAREEANKLVHAIAVGYAHPGDLLIAIASLRVYGFERLADTLVDRSASVKIEDLGDGTLALTTPYNPDFVTALKAVSPWRRWDSENKRWLVSGGESVKKGLFAAMKRHYPMTLGVGPRGAFAIA